VSYDEPPSDTSDLSFVQQKPPALTSNMDLSRSAELISATIHANPRCLKSATETSPSFLCRQSLFNKKMLLFDFWSPSGPPLAHLQIVIKCGSPEDPHTLIRVLMEQPVEVLPGCVSPAIVTILTNKEPVVRGSDSSGNTHLIHSFFVSVVLIQQHSPFISPRTCHVDHSKIKLLTDTILRND
jgi:hypothetical protein